MPDCLKLAATPSSLAALRNFLGVERCEEGGGGGLVFIAELLAPCGISWQALELYFELKVRGKDLGRLKMKLGILWLPQNREGKRR